MDASTHQRVSKLTDEIGLLRHENEVYRSQKYRTGWRASGFNPEASWRGGRYVQSDIVRFP